MSFLSFEEPDPALKVKVIDASEAPSYHDAQHSEDKRKECRSKWEALSKNLKTRSEEMREVDRPNIPEIYYRGFVFRLEPDPETYDPGFNEFYIYKAGQRKSAWGWSETIGDCQDLCDREIEQQKEWILAVAKDLASGKPQPPLEPSTSPDSNNEETPK